MTQTWLHHPSESSPCTVIAEIGQGHDGSLGFAHAFVDCAARAGVDAIKFQTHLADAESTPAEPWRKAFSAQDLTRYDYWKRMEFTKEQWEGLRRHAEERGLLFFSSPFSLEAIQLLRSVGNAAWKVASGETNNHALIDAMAETGQPVLLSTGMSLLSEIDQAVERIRRHRAPLAVMQCTSAYPCPPEWIGLNVLTTFRNRYGCAVGLSDHSGTPFPGLGAVALGAQVLEVHLTLSRDMFGPDVPSSLTPDELAHLVTGVRMLETILRNPVDKDAMPEPVRALRSVFTKSVVAAVDLPAGTQLVPAHLAAKKPGSGIPANQLPELLGRTLKRAVIRNTLLSLDDLETVDS